MSENIQRTPEQQARLDARAARKAQVDALDAQINAEQATLDGHNQEMMRLREKAVEVVQRLDVLKQQRIALLTPLAAVQDSEALDALEPVVISADEIAGD